MLFRSEISQVSQVVGKGGGFELDCPDLLRLTWGMEGTDLSPLPSTLLGRAGAQWLEHLMICPHLALRSDFGPVQLSWQPLFHRPTLPALAMTEP